MLGLLKVTTVRVLYFPLVQIWEICMHAVIFQLMSNSIDLEFCFRFCFLCEIEKPEIFLLDQSPFYPGEKYPLFFSLLACTVDTKLVVLFFHY